MIEIKDTYDRKFKKLRISLTDVCNLACKYCVPDGVKAEQLSKKYVSTTDLLETIKSLHENLNFQKVRLTGGEPLLHQNIEEIVEGIHRIGIDKIAITTNGLGISKKIDRMVANGLHSVNISLDASTDSVFEQITGFDKFAMTVNAIDKCVTAGLDVKLNTVILKGKNEDEILPLLDFAQSRGIELRFLELMRMGKVNSYFDQFYFSAGAIKQIIATKYNLSQVGRPSTSTTRYYELGNKYRFGIIENESTPFCTDCDRLRLGSDLKLYGCITATEGVTVKDALKKEDLLQDRIQEAMNQKQVTFIGSKKSMIKVGG